MRCTWFIVYHTEQITEIVIIRKWCHHVCELLWETVWNVWLKSEQDKRLSCLVGMYCTDLPTAWSPHPDTSSYHRYLILGLYSNMADWQVVCDVSAMHGDCCFLNPAATQQRTVPSCPLLLSLSHSTMRRDQLSLGQYSGNAHPCIQLSYTVVSSCHMQCSKPISSTSHSWNHLSGWLQWWS